MMRKAADSSITRLTSASNASRLADRMSSTALPSKPESPFSGLSR